MGFAHPVVGPPFRYRSGSGGWPVFRTAQMKKAGCGFGPYFVYVH